MTTTATEEGPTVAELLAEADALPAKILDANRAGDADAVMRLQARIHDIHTDIDDAQRRELTRAVADAWAAAPDPIRTATAAADALEHASAAAEAARSQLLHSPGDTPEQRIAAFASYHQAQAKVDQRRSEHQDARRLAVTALAVVDLAVAALAGHLRGRAQPDPDPEWAITLIPHRLLTASAILTPTDLAGAEPLLPEADAGAPHVLQAGTVLPRAVAYTLGGHLLGDHREATDQSGTA